MPSDLRASARVLALFAVCALCTLALSVRSACAQPLQDPLAAPWPAPAPPAPLAAPPAPASDRVDPVLLELSLKHRLTEVRSEELRLLRLDRAAEPLTVPLLGVAAGFGLTAGTFLVVLNLGSQTTQTGEEPPAPSKRTSRILAGTALSGMTVGFASLGFLGYRLRHRPHRAEARELQEERKDLQRRLKDVIRQQQEGWSLTPALSHREQGAILRFNRRF